MELLVGSGRTPRSSLSLADREESGVFAARAVIVPIAGGLLLPKCECMCVYRLWIEEHNLHRGFKTSLYYCLLHVPRRVHLREERVPCIKKITPRAHTKPNTRKPARLTIL